MKQLLIIILLSPVFSLAQKTGKYSYKNVDTLYQYENAQIVIYKEKGRCVSDTIFFNKMTHDIDIAVVSVMIVDQRKKLMPKTQ